MMRCTQPLHPLTEAKIKGFFFYKNVTDVKRIINMQSENSQMWMKPTFINNLFSISLLERKVIFFSKHEQESVLGLMENLKFQKQVWVAYRS